MDDLKKKTTAAPAEMSAEEVMQKFDKESNKREPDGFWGYVISAICILFACFQLYTGIFGVLDAHLQRTIHLCFLRHGADLPVVSGAGQLVKKIYAPG